MSKRRHDEEQFALVERHVLISEWHAQSEAVGVVVFGSGICEPKTATAFTSVHAVPPKS